MAYKARDHGYRSLTLSIMEYLLIIALAAGLVRVLAEIRNVRVDAFTAAQKAKVSPGQRIPWLFARAENGERLSPKADAIITTRVIFVIHASTFRQDVDYWNRVAESQRLEATRGIWLTGYCDGTTCNNETAKYGPGHLSVAAFGEMRGLDIIHNADGLGDLLITNGSGLLKYLYAWRLHTPDETAQYLGTHH